MSGVEKRCTITADTALRILNRVYEQATADGKGMFVAVVDGAGELIGFLGHQNVPQICRQIAQDKAFTAFATRGPTSAWKAYVYGAPEEERALMLSRPRFIAAAGGCPIVVDGLVAGAVGVSGAGQQEDEDLAALGAALVADRRP